MLAAIMAMFIVWWIVALVKIASSRAEPPPPVVEPRYAGSAMERYYPYMFTDLATVSTGRDPRPINRFLDELAKLNAVEQHAAPTTTDPEQDTAVYFKDYEPQTFEEFDGQRHVTRPLQAAVQALEPTQRVISHRLLTGLPGRGKTLIAKVLAHTLRQRCEALGLPTLPYLETFAANLTEAKDLDFFAQKLLEAGGGIWFIDEIHVLNKELATKLYLLMEEGRYPFAGSGTPTPIPDVLVIGATTDYGNLHGALKRRFGESLMVRALNREELKAVILRSAFPVTPDAAELIVERTHWSGAPWEAVMFVREGVTFAKARGSVSVGVDEVLEVCSTYEIDDFGLRWYDREVIRTLFTRPRYRGKAQEFVCFAAAESDICAVVGLDPEEYRTAVKPRLMTRGLLEVRSGYGQALTTVAIEHPLLSHLKSSDPRCI